MLYSQSSNVAAAEGREEALDGVPGRGGARYRARTRSRPNLAPLSPGPSRLCAPGPYQARAVQKFSRRGM